MSRAPDICESWADKRIRQGTMIVAGYTALLTLAGYGYLVAKLVEAELGLALVALVATLAGCGVGAVAWGGLRLARLTVTVANNLERIRYRLDTLEATVDLRSAEAELDAAGGVRTSEADRTQEAAARFPPSTSDAEKPGPAQGPSAEYGAAPNADLVPGPGDAGLSAVDTEAEVRRLSAALEAGDLRTSRRVWASLRPALDEDRVTALQCRMTALQEKKSQTLREEFAALVRAENFKAALLKGEEIAELFPDSRMTAEFKTIRPHLQRRGQQSAASETENGPVPL